MKKKLIALLIMVTMVSTIFGATFADKEQLDVYAQKIVSGKAFSLENFATLLGKSKLAVAKELQTYAISGYKVIGKSEFEVYNRTRTECVLLSFNGDKLIGVSESFMESYDMDDMDEANAFAAAIVGWDDQYQSLKKAGAQCNYQQSEMEPASSFDSEPSGVVTNEYSVEYKQKDGKVMVINVSGRAGTTYDGVNFGDLIFVRAIYLNSQVIPRG